ncbi:MAG: DUF2441 domain-containing protein [Leptospiraceae bacterium]|nr:DUF2441 domain-containing protein [Leptospiraceae bacterium]
MNEGNEYYWLGYYELGKGSTVYPGNWGRIKNKTFATSPNTLKELIYENIRLRYFPNLPSRLSSIFVCPSLEEIIKYQRSNNKVTEVIHKVKLVNEDANRTMADWSKFILSQNDSFEMAEQRAKDYWSRNNIQNPEILIESAIEIMDIHK